MRTGCRRADVEVRQLWSHDETHFLNVDADYGWLRVTTVVWRNTAAALIRFKDSNEYSLVLFDRGRGLPEEFADAEIIWQA